MKRKLSYFPSNTANVLQNDAAQKLPATNFSVSCRTNLYRSTVVSSVSKLSLSEKSTIPTSHSVSMLSRFELQLSEKWCSLISKILIVVP